MSTASRAETIVAEVESRMGGKFSPSDRPGIVCVIEEIVREHEAANAIYLYRVGSRDGSAEPFYGDELMESEREAMRARRELEATIPRFDDVWIERAPLGAWERLP